MNGNILVLVSLYITIITIVFIYTFMQLYNTRLKSMIKDKEISYLKNLVNQRQLMYNNIENRLEQTMLVLAECENMLTNEALFMELLLNKDVGINLGCLDILATSYTGKEMSREYLNYVDEHLYNINSNIRLELNRDKKEFKLYRVAVKQQ